jgi:CelD/BcsL family acetyltransferase involved in cellulose biosynthesis
VINAQNIAISAMKLVAAPALAGAPPRPFADLKIVDDVAEAEAAWAELYAEGLATPYQSRAFAETWLQTIGRTNAVEPLIVVARDETGRPSAILPLGVRRVMGVRLAEFVGGKHANFHMGVYRRDLAVERGTILDLLRRVSSAARVDAFLFINQPLTWRDRANPFAALPRQESPSLGHSTRLQGNYRAWLDAHYSNAAQKKLRKKARRLAEIGATAFVSARDQATASALLSAFFAHKSAQAKETGFSNDFDEAGAVQFLEAAAKERSADGKPLIELHGLWCGDRIVAVFGGLAHASRFSGMLTSYDQDSEIARSSPGELLIHEVIRDLTTRGFTAFDLGVGEARYKNACCEIEEPLFDTAIGFTLAGRTAAGFFRGGRGVKRWVKRRAWVWSLVATALRRPH